MMGVLGQMPLLDQGGDFLGRQPVARLDRRLARDHVQKFVQHVAPRQLGAAGCDRRRPPARPPSADRPSPADFRQAQIRQHRRIAGHQHRVAAERLDDHAQAGQHSRAPKAAAASAGLRSTGSGTSRFCDSSAPASTFSRNCSYKNPLVQRVLIDHHHAFFALGDQISIVDLQRRHRAPCRPPLRRQRRTDSPARRHAARAARPSESAPHWASRGAPVRRLRPVQHACQRRPSETNSSGDRGTSPRGRSNSD